MLFNEINCTRKYTINLSSLLEIVKKNTSDPLFLN